ncbi:MAG: LuxR C-terminal-related transcriptional regulator [Chloroflexota bacterium]
MMRTNALFGQWLKERRKALDLTQETLAEKIGCAVVTIQKIEGDDRRPSRNIAQQLAQHLGVPLLEQSAFMQFARGVASPVAASWGQPSPVRPRLTASSTPFIGRDDEIEAVRTQLITGEARLLTLVGPGGIGKTQLAIEAAQRLPFQAHGSVHFIPLQPVASPNLLASAIADTLGIQFYPGSNLHQQLLDYLHEKSLLLVLDNFEHLVDGAALLSEILASALSVRMLVTSRERLNLVEEWVLDVNGLAYPSDENDADADHYSAVELFVQHARRAKIGFTLTNTSRPAVLRICRLVDGMPLGIELAASWVRAISCEAIADEIERSLDILETPTRNIEPRHRTMRAAFEPTWARLSADERAVFMRLSVFRGGFTREAAQDAAGASLRTLSALVDKSLLRVDASGRYDVHELLRQYGEEQLTTSPDEAEQAGNRHCHYYATFLADCWPRLTHNQIKVAFDEIEIELSNVRAAWDWALRHYKSSEIEAALDSIEFFYGERGHYHEGQREFARAASIFNDNAPDSIHMRAKLQARQAWMLLPEPGSDKGLSLLRESIVILRRIDARFDLAYALHRLAMYLSDNNLNSSEVAESLQESLAIFMELDDRWRIADVLSWLSIFHHREFARRRLQGALEKAEACAFECLAIYQQLDSSRGIASAYLNLADVANLRGEYEKCKEYTRKSLGLFREIGIFWGIMISLMLMGETACTQGVYAEARRCAAQGLQASFDYQLASINFYSLHLLALAVQIWLGEREMERAYELIGFLDQLHQKSSEKQRQHTAFVSITLLQDNLPSHLKVAVERGRARDADTFMREIIADFSRNAPGNPATSLIHPQSHVERLSSRELDVLCLVAEGFSNQEIADRLYIGVSTVKKHINHIYDKLDAKNRTQAVAYARERQMLIR